MPGVLRSAPLRSSPNRWRAQSADSVCGLCRLPPRPSLARPLFGAYCGSEVHSGKSRGPDIRAGLLSFEEQPSSAPLLSRYPTPPTAALFLVFLLTLFVRLIKQSTRFLNHSWKGSGVGGHTHTHTHTHTHIHTGLEVVSGGPWEHSPGHSRPAHAHRGREASWVQDPGSPSPGSGNGEWGAGRAGSPPPSDGPRTAQSATRAPRLPRGAPGESRPGTGPPLASVRSPRPSPFASGKGLCVWLMAGRPCEDWPRRLGGRGVAAGRAKFGPPHAQRSGCARGGSGASTASWKRPPRCQRPGLCMVLGERLPEQLCIRTTNVAR
ncbi:uncharacterized protein LOC128316124 [Acinonyx jubatus]|uniref:Uncharacterized protein LOC128316124 n=1 Tax=Acinonyx jubatus TaxID=32536 RepID=A0ABM3QAF6_ACIJB|nr:uncharacterized protein LOC128316124 [Acinonyx jubatus]XP_053080921.1 uncharacterized protein LOC128316124 [Acinonyx jubatus]